MIIHSFFTFAIVCHSYEEAFKIARTEIKSLGKKVRIERVTLYTDPPDSSKWIIKIEYVEEK